MKRVKLNLPDIGQIEGYTYKGFLVMSHGEGGWGVRAPWF